MPAKSWIKPRTRHANPKHRLPKKGSSLNELKLCEAKICGTIPSLLAQKVMKGCESELMRISNAPDSILNLAKIAQRKGLLPLPVVDILESLDFNISRELRCRYLMLHVKNSMISKQRLITWLEALSAFEGADSIKSLALSKYNSLVRKVGSELAKILSEHLSDQWQAFAASLGIPSDEIRGIETQRSSADALEEVILIWLQCDFKDNQPQDLEVVLQHHKYCKNQEAIEEIKKLYTVELLDSSANEVQIIDQTMDFRLNEEDSALIEVQIEGYPKGFEWCLYESTIASAKHSIIGLPPADLMSEGYYLCNVRTYGDEEVVSKPIHVTVNTSLDKHQQILLDRYTAQPEVPVDTWPPKSSVSFIILALIKQGSIQISGEYGRCTIRGDMDDIYKDKEDVTYDQAMGNLSSGARVLIEGRPGCGKTTFVHKFSRDWANKEVTIRHVRLLFLIQLRGFSSDSNIGLRDIIGCYYKDCLSMDDIEYYAVKHSGLGLGFVMDGLDEYIPRDRDAFIFRLIRKEVLPKSVVIVASRPAAAADFRPVADRQIEVLGFLKPQIRDYINSYNFSIDSKRISLHQYLDASPNVLHMCYLPIHISMVCFLYNMLAKDLPQTETEIYSVFTKFAVLRMLYRCNKKSEVSLEALNDLSPLHKSRYLEVCKLAFKMTLSTKQVMRQAEVDSLLATIEEKELFGLITVDNIATMCGFQDVYTFLHLTFQEFLAAYYISSLNEKEQMELIEKHGKAIQMKQVWKFYCGLVKFDSSGSKFKTLVSQAQHGALHRIQCSFESQQPSTCDHVVEDNCLKFADCFLTSSDFTAMSFVISNAYQQCVLKVVLDKCTFGLEGVGVLASKGNARLSLITTLCYHGHNCTSSQLVALKKLASSLSCLKIIDVTNTNIEGKHFVTDFKHSTLKVLKVSDTHSYYTIAKEFFSQCSNFVNICFSGCDPRTVSTISLPYVFYCNFQEIDMSFCKLKPIELLVFESDLQINGERTTTLSLTGCGIGDSAASCLARGIKHCTALEILNLSCNLIGDEGAISLGNSINSYTFKLLNVSCNKIGNLGALAIAGSLKLRGCRLHMWNNSFSDHENVIAIMPQTDFGTFDFVRLRRDTSLTMIIDALGHCNDLRTLTLTKMELNAGDFKIFADYLKHTSLFKLDLNHSHIDAGVLARALKSSTVRSLNISSCGIRDIAIFAISQSIKFLNLHELDISFNGIHWQGAQALARALRECSKLAILDVSHNHIQSNGACALAGALVHCTNLTKLNIGHNGIGSNGIKEQLNVLISCTKLEKLDLSGNELINGIATYFDIMSEVEFWKATYPTCDIRI